MNSVLEAEGTRLCTLNIDDLKLSSRLKADRIYPSVQDSVNCMKACLFNNVDRVELSNGTVLDLSINKLSENFIVNTIEDSVLFIIAEAMHSTDDNFTNVQIRDTYEYLEYNYENIKPEMLQTARDLRALLEIITDYITYKENRVGSKVLAKFFYELMLNLVSGMKSSCYRIVLKYDYKKLLKETSEFTGDDSKYFA